MAAADHTTASAAAPIDTATTRAASGERRRAADAIDGAGSALASALETVNCESDDESASAAIHRLTGTTRGRARAAGHVRGVGMRQLGEPLECRILDARPDA